MKFLTPVKIGFGIEGYTFIQYVDPYETVKFPPYKMKAGSTFSQKEFLFIIIQPHYCLKFFHGVHATSMDEEGILMCFVIEPRMHHYVCM